MDHTRTNLLTQYREEADAHLLRLSQGIVALEQDPANAPLLKEIFRAAHTIKGAAKMMGFKEISRVTHEMESVLAAMRDGELILTPEISDVLFEAIDLVMILNQTQTGGAAADAAPPPAVNEMISRLQAILQPPGEPDALGAELDAAGDLLAGQENGHGSRGRAATDNVPAAVAPVGGTIQSALEDTVRVQVQKLDTLMNLSGEMVISKMQNETIAERLHGLLDLGRRQGQVLATLTEGVTRRSSTLSQHELEDMLAHMHTLAEQFDQLASNTLREFESYATHLGNVADELEDTVLSVRMMPVESLFTMFPRAVRDMARDNGKQIELLMRGGETELDKKIMEALYDPLVHLLRNAVDHGIEAPAVRDQAGKPLAGRVSMRAFQQGGQVVIEVADDGGGIDLQNLRRIAVQKSFLTPAAAEKLSDDEMLQWIYYPGFTTAQIITDVSGRGVGMDIVKTTLERLNGTVQISAHLGRGTTVTLKVPLTLATMQGLLVRVTNQVFVLPSHTVETMAYIGAEDLFNLEGREVVRLRERAMPLIRLEELLDLDRVGAWHYHIDDAAIDSLGLQAGITLANKLPGIVVGDNDRLVCFLVDELIDERVIVVKSLGPLFSQVETQVGATLLGNGQVVIILDVPSLITEARARSSRGLLTRAWRAAAPAHTHRILVVDDSITTRELEKSILENAGYEVEIAMDGRAALTRLEREPERFAMMIADIEMPEMDGLELTERVKDHANEHLRRLPVIIVSSLASDAYKRRGIEVGAQAYITKGQFEQSRLLETIELLIH